MEFKKPRKNSRPEDRISAAVQKKFREEGWFVIKTHGNAFQSGLPDLYCAHAKYGARWVETKVPGKGCITAAQWVVFNKLNAKNIAIYIITKPEDYKLIFGPSNWPWYTDPKWRKAMKL